MAEEPATGRLLTPQEAAAYLGATVKTLENWRGTGAGPTYVKLSAKCVRYVQGDLDEHIRASRRRHTADRG